MRMDWEALVAAHCVGHKPSRPLESASIVLTRLSSSEPDADNLVSSFKFILDGLTKCGVILDDKPSIIGIPEFRWQKTSPKKGRIRIHVRGGSTVEIGPRIPVE